MPPPARPLCCAPRILAAPNIPTSCRNAYRLSKGLILFSRSRRLSRESQRVNGSKHGSEHGRAKAAYIMIGMLLRKTAFLLFFCSLLAAPVAALDLRSAVVVAPAGLMGPEKKAAARLVDEIEKRTRIRLSVGATWSGLGTAILL